MRYRPLSEAFIRRSWYSVLPVLDTTGRRRVKKAVCVAQLVAALITVHGLLSFLSDVYGLFGPSGKTLWLSVDHRRLRPVDDMVLLLWTPAQRSLSEVHVIFCQCIYLSIYFLWPFYAPALVNGGSRKFYTWWTLSVNREVTTWIFSWSSLNYRVGQK